MNRGRFWSQDTFEGSGEEPLSLHKYLYSHGDPINRLDPSGNRSIVETLAVAAIYAGILSNISGLLLNTYKAATARTEKERDAAAFAAGVNALGLITAFAGGGFGGSLLSNGNQLILNAASSQTAAIAGITSSATGFVSIAFAVSTGGSSGGSSGGGGGSPYRNDRSDDLPTPKSTKWSSTDPFVAKIANLIEDRFPGHVTRVNDIIKDPTTGRTLTDIDIETSNAIIVVKQGTSGLTSQVAESVANRIINPAGKPVIAFSPKAGIGVRKDVEAAGGIMSTKQTFDALLDIIAP